MKLIATLLVFMAAFSNASAQPLASGVKIGEVDQDTLKNDCCPDRSMAASRLKKACRSFVNRFRWAKKHFTRFDGQRRANMADRQPWFRSPNDMKNGPDIAILGAVQKKWLMATANWLGVNDADGFVLPNAKVLHGESFEK